MVATFFMWIAVIAVAITITAAFVWMVQTTWAWLERSDRERELTPRQWVRFRRIP